MFTNSYQTLARVLPTTVEPPTDPQRIVLIRPCCIGDVMMATAALDALRRHYPRAHITWAVGGWARAVVEHHTYLDDVLDTGEEANPVKSTIGFGEMVAQLRAGNFDLAVSLVRTPLMSAAVFSAGIPYRAGLDSDGRGFGYNIRVPVDPEAPENETDLYLKVIAALGADVRASQPSITVAEADHASVIESLIFKGVTGRFAVVNPAGGSNPGARMDVKRWPPENFARLINGIAPILRLNHVVLVAGPGDGMLTGAVSMRLSPQLPAVSFVGQLTFGQIAALAAQATLYVGNDTGLSHIAAATGTPTVMIFGPTDPARYKPRGDNVLTLWQPHTLGSGSAAEGPPPNWTWKYHGIDADEATRQVSAFMFRD